MSKRPLKNGASDGQKALASVSSIEKPFLRQRMADYVDCAQALFEALDGINQADKEGRDKLRIDLGYFSKLARRIDLILSVAGSANYLSPQDLLKAENARRHIETKLGAFAKRKENGGFVFSSPSVQINTHSPLGRKIAKFFARKVPVSEKQGNKDILPESMFLDEEAIKGIKADLEKAQKYHANGQYPEAEALYKKVLRIDRKNKPALRWLGSLYSESACAAQALACLNQVRNTFVDDDDCKIDRGRALMWQAQSKDGDFAAALKILQEAVEKRPNNALAAIELAKTLFFSGNDEKALFYMDKAYKLAPNDPRILAETACLHKYYHNLEKAALNFTQALKIFPKYPLALMGYGSLLACQRRYNEALELYDRGLQIDPNKLPLLGEKAFALLSSGQYKEGWAFYEKVLSPRYRGPLLFEGKPMWKGESNPKLRLLISCEQGLGDNIHFVRYAALCKERVGKVVVLCPKSLKRLFAACPGVDKAVTTVRTWQFDSQISMMSLPHVFGTTLETIPSKTPYFFLPEKTKAAWKRKVTGNEFKIGLVWAGSSFNVKSRGDLIAKRRNVHLKQLSPLFDFKNTVFYNLQLGDEAGQIAEVNLQNRFVDLMPGVKDMADTAAIIDTLDLVLSVDTSVAHVAGALGKPVWILSRYDADWRWLQNQPSSPWYPTARIFGQPKSGDWSSAIDAVRLALQDQINSPH